MKKLLITLTLACVLVSCKQSNESLLKDIDALMQSEELGQPEGLEKLASLHEKYGLRNSDSLGNAYLYAAALHHYHSRDTGKAINLLSTYLDRDDSSQLFRNVSMNLANLKSGTNEHQAAVNLVYAAMEKQMLDGGQWRDAAIIIQRKMDADSSDYIDYTEMSKVQLAIGNTTASINALDSAIIKYPNESKRPDLLLRAGFLAWEHLENKELAEKYYTQFLSEYPDHQQVSEIKNIMSSGYLGMSNEEILKQLQSNK